MQADLILYALVAAGLVFWLRSVLGTRHGDERERPNPFTAAPADPAAEAASPDGVLLSLPAEKPVLPRNVTIVSEKVESALMDFARQEPDFDLLKFAQGAQDAFAIIVEAFAAGDRDTLRSLLEPSVYGVFERSIEERAQSAETVSTEIHAVKKAEILDAETRNKTMYVTVRFIADETCVVKNKDGVVLSGDPDRITEMNDIWIFSKPLRSRDPRWFLHETRDGEVVEDHKTPLPDSH